MWKEWYVELGNLLTRIFLVTLRESEMNVLNKKQGLGAFLLELDIYLWFDVKQTVLFLFILI